MANNETKENIMDAYFNQQEHFSLLGLLHKYLSTEKIQDGGLMIQVC